MSATTQFTGEIPVHYDRYLGPFLFEPYAADLAGRVAPREGARVLEVACGTGVLTRRLRAVLPASASITATDLNEAMVAYARAAPGSEDIRWAVADAQALPFEDGSFDAVLCQFGLMFLPDKAQGFREARRVLAPGGQLLANVWRAPAENAYVLRASELLSRHYPVDPPAFLDTPFGYHDADRIRADASAGGWQQIALDDVRLQGESPAAVDFATGFLRGSPLVHELLARGADLDALVSELGALLARDGGARPFRAALAATVISAER
jgi:SAM-dependent methyltransferase